MERLVAVLVAYAGILVPVLALWAIVGLYSLRAGMRCLVSECLYFLVMLLISVITLHTMLADGSCWLIHTASLGVMIVAGVMRRTAAEQADIELARLSLDGWSPSE